ncbi:hypothetical protein JXA34_04095 [Patescibacteria group bacterium]|nr:hypothetical protein [Patescibacteria group bacterium]
MTARIVATTQEHLDVFDIKDNVVLLKNGTSCVILQTTAVNFDLLSEIEQDAIIAAFSMLLNSITFSLQVVLRSKKLDISKYIEKVQKVESKITDPLLKYQMESYRKFVQEFITQNEVLDKRFYIVIPSIASGGEAPGVGAFDWISRLMGTHKKTINVDIEKTLREAKVQLMPKVEHMVKEFNRLSIKARPLTTQELVELYFDIYNPSSVHGQRIRTSVSDYTTAIVNPAIIEE